MHGRQPASQPPGHRTGDQYTTDDQPHTAAVRPAGDTRQIQERFRRRRRTAANKTDQRCAVIDLVAGPPSEHASKALEARRAASASYPRLAT